MNEQSVERFSSSPLAGAESVRTIFLAFLRLGLTSFGGPIAHLGYFREEFVNRRRWMSEHSYADLVALCQFLPGPASSQVGMPLGLSQRGYRGGLGASSHGALLSSGALHGLKVVAVAVVAQAVWGMARTLCTDTPRISIMAVAACLALAMPSSIGQMGIIAASAFAGIWLLEPALIGNHDPLPISISHRAGVFWLSLLAALLLGLPVLSKAMPYQAIADFDAFFRAGALVFGGGHVVLLWYHRLARKPAVGIAQGLPQIHHRLTGEQA
jgi:chromate transporter